MNTTLCMYRKPLLFVLCCALALGLGACASADKAQLAAGADTTAAVAEIEELAKQAGEVQAELLSYREYSQGMEHLNKARRGLAGDYQSEYILEHAGLAKTHLQRALELASAREINAIRILQSRRAALDAGLGNSASLQASLTEVDDDLRDETDNFSVPLEPREFSEFQKRYFSLEAGAVQFTQLDAVKNSIQTAARADAEDLAPSTLRNALLDVGEAENLIAQSPRDPGVHGAAVTRARASAQLLSEVMDVILDAPGTPEASALKIVEQNRALAKLSADVGSLEQNLKSTRSSLAEKQGELEQQTQALQSTRSNLQETSTALMIQNQELEKNSTRVRFQRAMDEAVRQFSEEEASVYQQGNKLIFRIKKINFPSGSATIPAASKPLLKKINSIIQALDAEMVVVQGHTDSIGATEFNKQLSTRRSVAVANYLASLKSGYKIGYIGYGESRPIVTNETKEGRAINRRVDLVVTARQKP